MNFQKSKVLEDGSTSGSDERFYEPAIKLRKKKTKQYKKLHHIEQVNKMLNGYIEQHELDAVDARLLVGIATKNPTQDDNKPPRPKVVMVNSPKKSPNKYGSGHFVEIALGMQQPQAQRGKKGKTVAPEIRVDTASSSGFNDRIDVGMSPTSIR